MASYPLLHLRKGQDSFTPPPPKKKKQQNCRAPPSCDIIMLFIADQLQIEPVKKTSEGKCSVFRIAEYRFCDKNASIYPSVALSSLWKLRITKIFAPGSYQADGGMAASLCRLAPNERFDFIPASVPMFVPFPTRICSVYHRFPFERQSQQRGQHPIQGHSHHRPENKCPHPHKS